MKIHSDILFRLGTAGLFRLAVAVLFCLLVPGSLRAGEGPVQVWWMEEARQRLDYALEISVEAEQRLQAEGPLLARYEITPLLTWKYSPRYDFGIGMEQSGTWNADDSLSEGYEGVFFATIKVPFKDYLLTSRQRFQAGVDEEEGNGVFRQQTRFSYEGERLPLRLKPFVSEEWFVDLDGGYFSENRFQLGASYTVNDHTAVSLFAMMFSQWTEAGDYTVSPVVGLSVNFGF